MCSWIIVLLVTIKPQFHDFPLLFLHVDGSDSNALYTGTSNQAETRAPSSVMVGLQCETTASGNTRCMQMQYESHPSGGLILTACTPPLLGKRGLHVNAHMQTSSIGVKQRSVATVG